MELTHKQKSDLRAEIVTSLFGSVLQKHGADIVLMNLQHLDAGEVSFEIKQRNDKNDVVDYLPVKINVTVGA